MNIYFLGTGAGTEPLKNIYHQSFAIETGGSVYFFDAGEGCSRRAHFAGVDLLKTKAVFITHTHMDHVAGLGGLLWNMRKLHSNVGYQGYVSPKLVCIPNISTYDAYMTILKNSEGGFDARFDVEGKEYSKGEIYRDFNISVTAFPTSHTNSSYSFVIKCEGKTLVYSGDIAKISDLDAPIGEACDALICETAHISLEDVCKYANTKNTDKLFLVHNGREVLYSRTQSELKAKRLFGENAIVANDLMTISL